MIEAWIAGLAVGYLLGSIPTGLWVGKWRGGGDIRASGSGRTGATNTFRRLGLKWSLLVLAVDAAKGAAPILIIGAAFDSPTGEVLGGLSAIAGHQFPLFAGFRGGRGAATALGATLAALPFAIACAVAAAAPLLWRSRVMSLSVLTGASAGAAAVGLFAAAGGLADAYIGYAAGAWLLIVIGHRDNIERIAAGTERVFGEAPAETG